VQLHCTLQTADWRIIVSLIFEFSLQLFLGYWIWVYADHDDDIYKKLRNLQ
jgi:hypothetical protein